MVQEVTLILEHEDILNMLQISSNECNLVYPKKITDIKINENGNLTINYIA